MKKEVIENTTLDNNSKITISIDKNFDDEEMNPELAASQSKAKIDEIITVIKNAEREEGEARSFLQDIVMTRIPALQKKLSVLCDLKFQIQSTEQSAIVLTQSLQEVQNSLQDAQRATLDKLHKDETKISTALTAVQQRMERMCRVEDIRACLEKRQYEQAAQWWCAIKQDTNPDNSQTNYAEDVQSLLIEVPKCVFEEIQKIIKESGPKNPLFNIKDFQSYLPLLAPLGLHQKVLPILCEKLISELRAEILEVFKSGTNEMEIQKKKVKNEGETFTYVDLLTEMLDIIAGEIERFEIEVLPHFLPSNCEPFSQELMNEMNKTPSSDSTPDFAPKSSTSPKNSTKIPAPAISFFSPQEDFKKNKDLEKTTSIGSLMYHPLFYFLLKIQTNVVDPFTNPLMKLYEKDKRLLYWMEQVKISGIYKAVDVKEMDLLLEETVEFFKRFQIFKKYVLDLLSEAELSVKKLLRKPQSPTIDKIQSNAPNDTQFGSILFVSTILKKMEIEKALSQQWMPYLVELERFVISESISLSISINSKTNHKRNTRIVKDFFNESEDEEGNEEGSQQTQTDASNQAPKSLFHFSQSNLAPETINSNEKRENDEEDENEEEDDNEDDNAKSSNLVEDVFFILKKSLKRAISTMNVNIITAILFYMVHDVLNEAGSSYLRELMKKLRKMKSKKDDYYSVSSFVEVVTSLNDLDLSSKYIRRLQEEYIRSCKQVFSFELENTPSSSEFEVEQTIQTLDSTKLKELSFEFETKRLEFLDMISKSIKQLVRTSSLFEQIENVIFEKQFKSQNYVISASEFDSLMNQSSHKKSGSTVVFSLCCIREIEKRIGIFGALLSRENFDRFIQELCGFICDEIERYMWKKKFNQLGALQFDKDVRELLYYFGAKSDAPLREKFSKISQMAALLKTNSSRELLEYWKENQKVQWKFEVNEMMRLISLRVDFTSEIKQVENGLS